MAGRFLSKKFSDINLDDPFFDSLKADYPGTESSTGFVEWFTKKANAGATALIFEDEIGLGAFVALKEEEEEIPLQGGNLPCKKRLKICTFRIAERFRRQRIGEGAIGLLLWKWQQMTSVSEIYLTTFEKQASLIDQFEKFGFEKAGVNLNGELVLLKNREAIDFSDPYKAFPFIKSGFDYAGYLIIEDHYHDTMFAYSELARTSLLQAEIHASVRNGLSKIYVGQSPYINHVVGEPVLIYRKYTEGKGARYRSCVTSYCIVTDIIQAKRNYRYLMSFEELKKRIGNKSVFDEKELQKKYLEYKDVLVMELLYYGYFGSGNNVNMDWLDKQGLWPKNQYPTGVHLTEEQFKAILQEGHTDVSNVIVD